MHRCTAHQDARYNIEKPKVCIDPYYTHPVVLVPDMGKTSPNKVLRSFPPLDAKEIIALTVLIVRNIPDHLYAELVDHAK